MEQIRKVHYHKFCKAASDICLLDVWSDHILGLFQAVQSNGRIEVVGTLHSSEGVRSLVKSVVGGLRAWQQPEASSEGLGGTYFFMNEFGEKQAIVKPCDEEPLAPNNPKVKF